LGGSHLAQATVTEAETIQLIHEAVDRGITFLDNSWDYNEGRSESRMGKALAENNSRGNAGYQGVCSAIDRHASRGHTPS
jgi:aryl-alcohol dehydrogenase-like predicted oxidoreductase